MINTMPENNLNYRCYNFFRVIKDFYITFCIISLSVYLSRKKLSMSYNDAVFLKYTVKTLDCVGQRIDYLIT